MFNMRRIVLAIMACLISLTSFSQITVHNVPESSRYRETIPPYDSTKNFLGLYKVKSYQGQVFYVKGVSKELQKYGYDNCYSIKKNNNASHYGVALGTYSNHSPYESLVGKYFYVRSVEDINYTGNYWLSLENRDRPGDVLWFYYQGQYKTAFPFIVVSHFDYLKRRYIGKEIAYFGRSTLKEFKVEFLKCNDIGIEDEHYNLSLFLDNDVITNVENDRELYPGSGFFVLKEVYDRLVKQYGVDMVHLAMSRKISVGMAEELLILAWGKPEDINRRSYSDEDQWVYGTQYVYVKKGIISAWSD